MPRSPTHELYRVADSCPTCGVCEVYQGHVCSAEERRLEEHCPACGKLLTIWQAGEVLYAIEKNNSKVNSGFRHARSVIKIPNPRIRGGHPTQKPLELIKYLTKVYSNPGDTVLDCCMGSGTAGVAAKELGRSFIGVEIDKKYFSVTEKRITEAVLLPS